MSKKIRPIAIFIFFPSLLFSQVENFDYYKQLNDEEARLIEYKDSDDMLKIKLEQLDYINKSRKKYNTDPVKMDILACRVANKQSKEAAEEKFNGHWNTRGEKPYHRWADAGGQDHIGENAASMWYSTKYNKSFGNQLNLMKKAHDGFMSETPPNDGHKKQVIDPIHNYIGIGCYITDHEFRYYEEYIDRYIKFVDITPDKSNPDGNLLFVKPILDKHFVYAVFVFYEPLPSPMTVEEVNSMGSYPDYTDETVLSIWPWDIEYVESTGNYRIPFSFIKSGSYYFHIYLSEEKFTEGYASTEGKIQASGIVIFVK
ncbi:MAG: CAP domain-containing protein [Ignavibacteriales bacterium]|nr:CAP domain-containing protein [Ignavibacteriales bacterium]